MHTQVAPCLDVWLLASRDTNHMRWCTLRILRFVPLSLTQTLQRFSLPPPHANTPPIHDSFSLTLTPPSLPPCSFLAPSFFVSRTHTLFLSISLPPLSLPLAHCLPLSFSLALSLSLFLSSSFPLSRSISIYLHVTPAACTRAHPVSYTSRLFLPHLHSTFSPGGR